MIKTTLPIYLASKSPRRRKLLKQLNLKFKSLSVDSDELVKPDELPHQSVVRIAEEKMQLARKKIKHGIIITADTIVFLDNEVLGKPSDEKDAFRMLKKLSGKTHQVFSAYCIHNTSTGKTITEFVKTDVTFRKLTNQEIKDYIKTGSPMDKAGAYGIQDDFGAVFVDHINGCYYSVVGLPLSKFYHALLRIL
ncbi:Putative septum formation protein [Ignavibacterium album JCM 16511]|uniref:dTTP/UTP pyrophosphatase n=1 Tax=Ignavibacterium album (strain DSM 19864 / JCM 16511 / NBRC 101810 / Mat9-16) TaxID=945713 RepID=I0AK85_IGNAJ|nr:Maf family protein [Ignavibacterium album]AFH49392.1 Putative septum formation protein [Ignavibacterium album JCM 16511]